MKTKLRRNEPPLLEGLFQNQILVVGYNSLYEPAMEVPISKPFKGEFRSEYSQNDIFVSSKSIPPITKTSYGVWKKKYDGNLKFTGWELYLSSPEKNNTLYLLEPTKIKENKVLQYRIIFCQSGFSPSNSEQAPAVGQILGVKI